jgi:predicted ferric reductase
MTVTAPPPTPTQRRGVPPARLAMASLVIAIGVNLAVVEWLFVNYGAGKNSVLTVAKFVGLHAALVMMLQLVLVARLPWLDRRLGMDRLTAWHRWVGFTLLWAVFLHATLIVTGYAVLDDAPWLRTFVSLAKVPASLLGMVAAAVVVGVAAVSVRAARRRLSYETWHAVHVAIYVAVLVAFVHQLLEGTTFAGTAWGMGYWALLWSAVLASFIVGRVVMPLWRNAYHQFRVSAVVPESDDAVSVYVTGRHLDRLPARAGQFFIWRFPGHNRWWQANPFSLSAAPDGRGLRLTAKAVGATSAGLRNLPVGTRVFAEGPYGAFTELQRARDATLLIAGGVGVTPIRSLLEVLTGPVVVLYRVRSAADAVLLTELQALAAARGAQLHVLTGRTRDGSPFDPHPLASMVPDIRERDVYVCGPPAMTEAVLRSLRLLKVPRRQVHSERFALAGGPAPARA